VVGATTDPQPASALIGAGALDLKDESTDPDGTALGCLIDATERESARRRIPANDDIRPASNR
jgi:hypothetical protein